LGEQPEAMNLSHSMLVFLLALVSLQGCAAGRPLSNSAINTFTPFQYSKFQKNFFVAWSESNVAAVDGGHTLQLSLNRKSGEHGVFYFFVSIIFQRLGISLQFQFGAY